MASPEELDQLKIVVREIHPVTTTDVRQAVERYFEDEITWSVLKDEWQNHMTDQQREALYSRLLVDCVQSETSRLRKLNLDDLDIDPSLND